MNLMRLVNRCAAVAIVAAAFCLIARAEETKPSGKTYRLACPDGADVFKLPPKSEKGSRNR